MRELFVLNVCACLAYSAVALLVWWVGEECLNTPVAKPLALSMSTSQLVANCAITQSRI